VPFPRPPCGAVIAPCRQRAQPPLGDAGAEGGLRAGCMVPVLPSSMPPDTLTLSEARPQRRRDGAERRPADRCVASPAVAG